MRETGAVLYESGYIVDVSTVTLGDVLAEDAASGATTLTLDDCADFDADTQVLIDGSLYNVTAVDDDASTITISPGLASALDEGEAVDVWDPLYQQVASHKTAQVRLLSEDSNEDIIEAFLANHLVDKLDEGIRGTVGESVLLEMDGDEWRIVDVQGFGDPDEGLGTKFWQDTLTVTETGDQTINLTHLPEPNSEHAYWNGLYQPSSQWSRTGQVLTISDSDSMFKVGDVLTVEYAYRRGISAGNPTVPDSTLKLLPEGKPVFTGNIAPPSNTGDGDIWIDDDPDTYSTLGTSWNGLLRQSDRAIIQLPNSDEAGDDEDAVSVWLVADMVIPTSVDFVRVRITETGTGIIDPIVLAADYTGPGGSVEFELTGNLDTFLARLPEQQLWVQVLPFHTTSAAGTASVNIRELRVEVREVGD